MPPFCLQKMIIPYCAGKFKPELTMLSNLDSIFPVTVEVGTKGKKLTACSVENLYVASKYAHTSDQRAIITLTPETALELVYGDKAPAKEKYWLGKHRKSGGIGAKIIKANWRKFENPNESLGWPGLKGRQKPSLSPAGKKKLMQHFQLLKAQQNPEYKQLLLSTGDATLMEYDRRATKDRQPLWAGKVIDGVIYGHNLAGKVLMSVRDTINT